MSSFPSSWTDLLGVLGTEYTDRNDATKWTAQIEKGPDPGHATKSNVTVKSVSLEITGFKITVNDGQADSTWEASPGSHGHPVKFNGTVHNEASLVFRPTGSPVNPGRFHLDIRWVKDGTNVLRLDTEYPKNP